MSESATFWQQLADFSEHQSPLDFVLAFSYIDKFLLGTWVTIQIVALSLLIGGLLAIPLAIARANKHPLFNFPIWCFTYLFRGSPLLVQLYLIYHGLAQFTWIKESFLWQPVLSTAWWCAIIAFSLNTAAYTTEFFRGAIENTPRGEIEAAKAAGMSSWTRMRRIVLPSAFRRALPAYSNEVIFMIHGSAVLSVITIQDILGVGRYVNGAHYLAFEGFIMAGLFYIAIIFVVTRLFRWLERRWLAHLRPLDVGVQTEDAQSLSTIR